MSDSLVPLPVIHNGPALATMRQLVTANAHDEVNIWEHILGLEKSTQSFNLMFN